MAAGRKTDASKNVIVLAGITACGKSTSMKRLLPARRRPKTDHPELMGRQGCYYRDLPVPSAFVFGGRQQPRDLPSGPLVVHWSLPSNSLFDECFDRSMVTLTKVRGRIEEIQLLICSYRCLLQRCWRSSDRRKLHLRHASNPERIIENYQRFADGCKGLGLKVRVMDTTKPGKLLYTKKSFREILSSDISLDRAERITTRLLSMAGIEKVL